MMLWAHSLFLDGTNHGWLRGQNLSQTIYSESARKLKTFQEKTCYIMLYRYISYLFIKKETIDS